MTTAETQPSHLCRPFPHLSDSVGQDVDDSFVGGGHHTLAVDLDDAVSHSDPPSLGDAPTHQAADLWREHSPSDVAPTGLHAGAEGH